MPVSEGPRKTAEELDEEMMSSASHREFGGSAVSEANLSASESVLQKVLGAVTSIAITADGTHMFVGTGQSDDVSYLVRLFWAGCHPRP